MLKGSLLMIYLRYRTVVVVRKTVVVVHWTVVVLQPMVPFIGLFISTFMDLMIRMPGKRLSRSTLRGMFKQMPMFGRPKIFPYIHQTR